jgi:hypothetical protein
VDNFEQMLRNLIREKLVEGLRPIREQLDRLNVAAPAVSDEDELSLGAAGVVSSYAPATLREAIHAGLAALKGRKEWRVKRGELKAWMHRSGRRRSRRVMSTSPRRLRRRQRGQLLPAH